MEMWRIMLDGRLSVREHLMAFANAVAEGGSYQGHALVDLLEGGQSGTEVEDVVNLVRRAWLAAREAYELGDPNGYGPLPGAIEVREVGDFLSLTWITCNDTTIHLTCNAGGSCCWCLRLQGGRDSVVRRAHYARPDAVWTNPSAWLGDVLPGTAAAAVRPLLVQE